MKPILFFLILTIFYSCETVQQKVESSGTYQDVQIAGAMKNVMWKGELDGIINLADIENKRGLYGLGPESYLTGELLINNGKAYVSRVVSDSTMIVEETFDVAAPFFVYANVDEWQQLTLPDTIKTITALETFIDTKTKQQKRPFAFRLSGTINSAIIHVQNLPKGTQVSSPQEAHQGQTDYPLQNERVDIIGFFSTQHQGVFTHHDSFLHMHLITANESKMGHLDAVDFDKMILYLPKK